MQCVIVGAAGFIGGHLGRYLHGAGHAVCRLDVDPRGAGSGDLPIDKCDVVGGPISIPAGTDVVYYLAQSNGYRTFPDGAENLFAVNVVGAVRAADAARRAGARLFVYASTGTVYAPSFMPMHESDAVRRDQPYALSKVCAEEALTLPDFGLNVLCPRLFGVFGPGQCDMLVPGIADRIRTGRPVTLQRNPHDDADRDGLRISLTYVEDLVATLADLVDVTLASDQHDPIDPFDPIVNVAGDTPVSVRTLAEELAKHMDRPPSFEWADTDRSSDFIADVSRLHARVRPRSTPLGEAIEKTLTVMA